MTRQGSATVGWSHRAQFAHEGARREQQGRVGDTDPGQH